MGKSKLKIVLAERDLSQKWLANETGLSTSTICQIVNGRTPRIESAYRIAEVLRVPIWRLWKDEVLYPSVQRHKWRKLL